MHFELELVKLSYIEYIFTLKYFYGQHKNLQYQ